MHSRARLHIRLAVFFATGLVSISCSSAPPDNDVQIEPTARSQIHETLQLYAIFLDDGRVDDFANLFTRDAVFTATNLTYEGRDEIRAELAQKDRRPGKHLPFPAVIEFESPTEARAWSDFLRVKVSQPGDPTSWDITSIGRYYDQLVRGEDGVWRFSRRDVQLPEMENLHRLVEPQSLPGSAGVARSR